MERTKAMTDALSQAWNKLKATYGPTWTEGRMWNLTEELDDYGPEPDMLIDAVKAHVNNTELTREGKRLGGVAPSPADILGHIQALEARADREVKRDEEDYFHQQIKEWEQQTQADKWKAVPLSELDAPSQQFWRDHNDALTRVKARGATQQRRSRLKPLFDEGVQAGKKGEDIVINRIHVEGDNLMIPVKRDWVKRCHLCADTGLAREWYDKADDRRVWLTDEYKTLPPDQQAALGIRPIVCTDCKDGEAAAIQFAGALSQGLMRNLDQTRALARRRLKREQATQAANGFSPKVYEPESEEVTV